MKLATWNINSLKVRLPHVLDWLREHPVDVLCLQETKLTDDKFPLEPLREAGYDAAFRGQPTYNGVAILWRRDTVPGATDLVDGIPGFEDAQKRVLAATLGDLRVICVYVPNGQTVGSDKYAYKLRWLDALREWLRAELLRHPKLVIAGDYNIAPHDEDVHDPAKWAGQVLFSEPERERLQQLFALGLHDAFRLFEQPPKSFSWWDYRMLGFRRNAGLRIDHLLISDALKPLARACAIDREPRRREQPSDHAPVWLEIGGAA